MCRGSRKASGICLRFSRQLEAILSLCSNKLQYCTCHSRGRLHADGLPSIRRMPFALDSACNPSISYHREYSGINALLIEPSQNALANHSYAVTLRLSRFEIDSVDSVPHVDKFMLPSEPHNRPIGREPQSIRLGTYFRLLTILNNSLLRIQLWD
jgi:hypothetical protein